MTNRDERVGKSTSEQPLISVILPVYNIKEYISRCMTSLFDQTYKNLEFVVVDDGSTDGSGELCDALIEKDPRVKVLHKENGGLSDARNYGISHSEGEYITCVDPDDYVDLDYIEYLYCLISKYHTRMSICQHRTFYDNGTVKDLGLSGDVKLDNRKCLEKMLYHDVIDTSAWAKLYEKSLFDKVEYPKGKIFEDIGTTYALMLQCPQIAIGYEAKYNYMFHANSIVNSAFKPNKFDMLEMTDKMAKDVLAVYPELKKAVMRRRIYARFSTLNQMLYTKDYEKERKEIINFIKDDSKELMRDSFAPKRDKAAIILLYLGYPVYKMVWTSYQRRIMNKS
ncbi:glycosyltransferase family 2 protein [Lactobacillus delbrueckii]|uniref:glycosyltransferase family 2 protein n=1 Tax=Lactobacillus delbrueckii TaxID=1584 RepID=UPI001E2F926D|nr:glycosyltransferase family 2 protein [Lactobacillus delbrueckii]MCD5452080.1 glycosyltransferase [Lactobacillus delbrueckii subsp. lactis]